jgi:C_GCAxxG_C_C family probable redox protein
MSARTEEAITKFLCGYNCAQSVLYAFRHELGLDEDQALKIATGFGAGMARKQEVCGAVTGGILVLSLRFGRDSKQDRSATEETYKHTRELMDQFAAKHGSCLCRQLLDGTDLNTPDGQQHFKETDLLNQVCKPCVQSVVEILEQMR